MGVGNPLRRLPVLAGAILIAATLGVLADEKSEKDDAERAKKLTETMEKLKPLHEKLSKPGPGDWLASHPEPGQTFRQYLRCDPTLPRDKRIVLYIQPLGDFTEEQRKIVTLTAEFMGLYFNLAVKVQEDLPLKLIPADAQRVHPSWGDKQVLTTYVLDKVLKPTLPDNAAALLALTASDLWPGEGWNFVFGEASLSDRVGVWSIYRNGDPAKDEAGFRLCLLRTLKTATHETGHMFSMLHCILYECNMCGCNNREEADRRPLADCPECMAKICWATRTDPAGRYGKLEEFFRNNGLEKERAFYEKLHAALGGEPAVPALKPWNDELEKRFKGGGTEAVAEEFMKGRYRDKETVHWGGTGAYGIFYRVDDLLEVRFDFDREGRLQRAPVAVPEGTR